MKVLWLCNTVPGRVRQLLDGSSGGGLWMDHVLTDLERTEGVTLRILCRGGSSDSGELNSRISWRIFQGSAPHVYQKELEPMFQEELNQFRPDVIHIWGTEYSHTLAMVNAAQSIGCLNRIAVSIQGLCSVYANHYSEGLPDKVQHGFTLRDFLKRDNVDLQRRKFAQRGQMEVQALRRVQHVIGRTPWDEACTAQINPDRIYHFCNETLREEFYDGTWSYTGCRRHRVFASSCVYPVKGFHYLLEAFQWIRKEYPDATLAVPGRSFLNGGARQSGYEKYLTELVRQAGMEDAIEFLGKLDADGMKKAYLESNVFALPSTIENSPNSLGEAMLLGVPCVAADVGGVSTMLRGGEEGYVYQGTAPYMLAYHILQVFRMQDQAEQLGAFARAHARKTHDPETNLSALLEAYQSVMKGY